MRYEVAVSIVGGDIVWVNGPYPCGEWNDLAIFRDGIIHYLDKNERVEADKVCVGEDPFLAKTPKGFTKDVKRLNLQGKVRDRHETVNKRFTQWEALGNIFRHGFSKHSAVLELLL